MTFESHDIPRRVLMTADTIGGVWTYAVELATALQDYGVEVDLATMGARLHAGQRAQLAGLEHVTVHESEFRLEWMEDPWEDVRAAGEWLLDLESRRRPELVHLNNYAHGALPWRVPVLVVGHSCVYSWHAAVKGSEPAVRWEPYRRAVSRGLRESDLVTAPTRTMLAALRKHYGAFRSSGPVYNGRRPDVYTPLSSEPMVLTAGRLWDEAKNMAVLDQVASGLPWPVYVAGETRHPDGGTVSFDAMTCLGQLSEAELARWMGRAAVFALPARYEPFGLTALEAGLSGCALVLGDVPSLREVWRDAACFVSADDAQLLRETLLRLIDDDEQRELMARRARERASLFTPERMVRGYLSLYKTLLTGRDDRRTSRPGIWQRVVPTRT